MGQRSQIFIRYNKKLIVANYYQWNYGERMISRARSIIEYLKEECLQYSEWYFKQEYNITKAQNYCDVNFDMKDMVLHSDIFKEFKEFGSSSFNKFAFKEQDNNDGKLLIDIDNNDISYCLLDYRNETILNAEDYLKWDCADEDGLHYSKVNWEKHYPAKCIDYTKENIKFINENAKLMTEDQVKDYLEYNYNI